MYFIVTLSIFLLRLSRSDDHLPDAVNKRIDFTTKRKKLSFHDFITSY